MIVFSRRRGEDGFALPTILIASTILMIVLTVAAAAATSISVSLGNQYYNQLAHEAAESGLSYARYCYNLAASTASSTQWPNQGNLTQGTDCFGAQKSGQNCTNAPGTQFCGIVNTSTVRTTFTVGTPVLDSNSASYSLEVTGTVQLLRTGDHQVYQTTNSTLDQQVSINLYGIASGNDTTCSIQAGQLYCWGANNTGQVGNGTTSTSVTTPYHVQNFPPVSGTTYSYVQYVATGVSHTCAVVGVDATPSDGNQVYCWGDNSLGQFGNNTTSSGSTVPVQAGYGMASNRYIGCTSTNYSCTAISARDHTCVMTESNSYPDNPDDVGEYCWGANDVSQAGLSSRATSTPLPAVSNPKLNAGYYLQNSDYTFIRPTTIANVSGESACAIEGTVGSTKSVGAVYCWGANGRGEFGNGTTGGTSPVGMATGITSGATQLATNNSRVCALKSGQLYCWGASYYWSMDKGIGVASNPNSTTWATSVSTPTKLITSGALNGVSLKAFAITDFNTCVVTSSNGQVWCWGYNNKGQLGQGTISGPNEYYSYDATNGPTSNTQIPAGANTPVQVKGLLNGQTVSQITSGNDQFCAITVTHASYCWGANNRGQLGNGSTTNSPVPTSVHIPATAIY